MGEGEGSELKVPQPEPAQATADLQAKELTQGGRGGVGVAFPDHPQSPQAVAVADPPPTQEPTTVAAVEAVKPDSPKSRGRPAAELEDGGGTQKKQKLCCTCKLLRCLKKYCECFSSGTYCDGCNCVNCDNNAKSEAASREAVEEQKLCCNCKHSRCLKLYCDCFSSGTYCDGCNCVNCYNNAEHEDPRREAVEATLERNPNAFKPKIASSSSSQRQEIRSTTTRDATVAKRRDDSRGTVNASGQTPCNISPPESRKRTEEYLG